MKLTLRSLFYLTTLAALACWIGVNIAVPEGRHLTIGEGLARCAFALVFIMVWRPVLKEWWNDFRQAARIAIDRFRRERRRQRHAAREAEIRKGRLFS